MAQAQDKANQLISVIATSPLVWEGNEIQLSCAVGLHEFHGQQSADDALSLADSSSKPGLADEIAALASADKVDAELEAMKAALKNKEG